ncbi:unnamed protein product [Dicrocoelium dendriticum]|nr:unnamed protein product [Dicrocoelium dendriticum]
MFQFLQLSLVLCVPSLMFSQGTGYPTWMAVTMFGILGATYSGLGVLQKMTSTNVLQLLLALGAVSAIITFGVQRVGDIETVIDRLGKARLLRLHPLTSTYEEEYTFVNMLAGGLFMMFSYLAVTPIGVGQMGTCHSRLAIRR